MNKVLKIDFYDKFKCTANNCDMNCCSNWRIDLDKKTFKKYKAIKGNTGKKICSNIMYQDRSSNSKYGLIKLNSNGKCSFQDENGLCEIHKNLGGEYLSKVCYTYPRIVKKINDYYEFGLDTSCPAVAKIGILQKEKITFNFNEENLHDKDKYVTPVNGEYRVDIFNIFQEIRSFCITILQSDAIPLWSRIFLLGILLNKVDEHRNNYSEIEKIIVTYKDYLNSDAFKGVINNIALNYESRVTLLMAIVEELNGNQINIQEQKDIYNYLASFFNQESNEIVIDNYKKIENGGYKKFIEENEYIFENYIVNNFYNKFYYHNEENKMFNMYLDVVIGYIMLRFSIMSEIVINGAEISEDRLCHIIANNSRAIEHNSTLTDNVIKKLKEKNMLSIAHLGILLKE